MSENDIGRAIYLIVLLVALGGYVMVQFRSRMGDALRHLLIWVLIGMGLMAGYGMWQDISRDFSRYARVSDDGMIVIPRAADGHYHLTLQVNGEPVEFLVDTGASDMVLSQADARKVGLDPAKLQFFGRANTANGPVQTAKVRLDTVQIGPHIDRQVSARVTDGALFGSLLGMRYLERFDRLEISGDRLTLSR